MPYEKHPLMVFWPHLTSKADKLIPVQERVSDVETQALLNLRKESAGKTECYREKDCQRETQDTGPTRY